MKVRGELIEARFVQRLNRFAALVEVDGRGFVAHVPNSGRMRELLHPGAEVLVAERTGPRKTPLDLLMARFGSRLVSIDSRLPPALLAEALLHGRLPELGGFDLLRREVRAGLSRLDLVMEGPDGPCFIETKSVTLVAAGVGLFPDAPTTRGTRHLEELRGLAGRGYRSAAVFIIQRDDVEAFSPFDEADPVFSAALRSIYPAVQILAYSCRVTPQEILLHQSVPVVLSRPGSDGGRAVAL